MDDPDYIYEMQRRQAYTPIKPEAVEPVEIRKTNSGWKRSGWNGVSIFNVLMWIGTTSLAGSIQSKNVKLVTCNNNVQYYTGILTCDINNLLQLVTLITDEGKLK